MLFRSGPAPAMRWTSGRRPAPRPRPHGPASTDDARGSLLQLLEKGIGIEVTAQEVTHQLLRRHVEGTVLTYYRALDDVIPAEGRRLLLETPHAAWAEAILSEMEIVHPDIRQLCTRLDVWRNGHAMRRPTVGSLFGGARERLVDFSHPRLQLAHADLSGLDRKSTRLNSSHIPLSRMPSSA